ncbi:MAG: hypothetical protein HQ514_17510 [Rhodospirillales bacterium]|nr:hypothetical protein [Rhodospirillales bacterium]
MTVTETIHPFLGAFFSAQGSSEAGFKGVREAISADRSEDDFAYSQRCETVIPIAALGRVKGDILL